MRKIIQDQQLGPKSRRRLGPSLLPLLVPKTNKRKQKGSFWSGTRDELRNGPTSCFLPVIINCFMAICTFCVFLCSEEH
jgi:hypothetical protein